MKTKEEVLQALKEKGKIYLFGSTVNNLGFIENTASNPLCDSVNELIIEGIVQIEQKGEASEPTASKKEDGWLSFSDSSTPTIITLV